jgi:hypothetical protein
MFPVSYLMVLSQLCRLCCVQQHNNIEGKRVELQFLLYYSIICHEELRNTEL